MFIVWCALGIVYCSLTFVLCFSFFHRCAVAHCSNQPTNAGQGTLKQKGKLPFTYTGAWAGGKRDGSGSLAFEAPSGTFTGTFEGGRPIAGGQFKWSDGTKDKFELDPRFDAYLGK